MYTWFLENRATKTCQSLATTGNLMALVTWKVNPHLKKKFLNTWASIWFDLIWFLCLEGNKSEAFLISLENKAFWETIFSVGVTDCKAISAVHPIFRCNWSPKNNLNQHCSTKPSPTTTSLTACWLGTLSTEWVIACMQTAQTNCITVRKHIKLYNNPTPLEFNQATLVHTRW